MAQYIRTIPQIPHNMDESYYMTRGIERSGYTTPHHHHTFFASPDMEVCLDEFENGMSMQPMQRFMYDQYPLNTGLLHAKVPLETQYGSYEQQYPAFYNPRGASPETTVSGDSTYGTQNELCSPQMYHSGYGSPPEYSQVSLPYPSVDHYHDTPQLSEPILFGGSINPREIEFEHPAEPEEVVEEPDVVQITQEAGGPLVLKAESIEPSDGYTYADSGIGNSVRDAESVQPADSVDEYEVDSDEDYSPTSRPGKRRRSSTSNSSSGRAQRRRSYGRKDSLSSSPTASTKTSKKARGSRGGARGAAETKVHFHDTRPFPCPLASYGCDSNFSSKNEWKRHVNTQHIKLGFWRCSLCGPAPNAKDENALYYNEFNRKDLFTQHLRRMHAAPKESHGKSTKHYPVNDDNLADYQVKCFLQLRTPPQQCLCLFCDKVFAGPAAWEERMEHVGRHLEKDRKHANGSDIHDVSAWNHDAELEDYLIEEGLIVRDNNGWKIGDGRPRRHSLADTTDSEEE